MAKSASKKATQAANQVFKPARNKQKQNTSALIERLKGDRQAARQQTAGISTQLNVGARGLADLTSIPESSAASGLGVAKQVGKLNLNRLAAQEAAFGEGLTSQIEFQRAAAEAQKQAEQAAVVAARAAAARSSQPSQGDRDRRLEGVIRANAQEVFGDQSEESLQKAAIALAEKTGNANFYTVGNALLDQAFQSEQARQGVGDADIEAKSGNTLAGLEIAQHLLQTVPGLTDPSTNRPTETAAQVLRDFLHNTYGLDETTVTALLQTLGVPLPTRAGPMAPGATAPMTQAGTTNTSFNTGAAMSQAMLNNDALNATARRL